MIVPMKKASIIVQAKDTKSAAEQLRRLGLLHVENTQPPQGDTLQALQEDLALLHSFLEICAQVAVLSKEEMGPKGKFTDWKKEARHVIELWKRYEQLQAYLRNLNLQISQWEHWGDFDPREIQHLGQKGVYVRLYQIPAKEPLDFPAEAVVKNIFTSQGMAHYLVLSRNKFASPLKEIALPALGLSQMKQRAKATQGALATIKQEIENSTALYAQALSIKKQLEKEIEFQQALAGMARQAQLSYIVGYVPQDALSQLETKAKEESWGILIREPQEEDNVPTLIRSPRWVSLISPLFKLLEIIPGYRELDISPLFLIFFSLFFGMIIGDAGYGIIYMLLTFLLQKKFGKKLDRKIFLLLYLLTSCAVFWGLLTGTVFGQEWYLKSGLKPLAPILNDTKFLQAFCFFLGAFHLSLGHLWQAIHKAPSLTALADLGWMSLLWAGFFLAKTLILNDLFPFFGQWLIIGGIMLVIFFTSPQKNVLKMVGQGLANVALSLMNNFTDVVSYIRLFAVGLAGVAIADTVNILASDFGASNPLVKAVIIFLGHTLNLTLAPLSVLIHGVRLNILEFSSHAGLTWSGVEYKPLRE